jgi:hypothetical protein
MDPTLVAIKDLIVAIGGLGGLTTVIVALFERNKKRAEAKALEADYADQISQTAMKLVDPLRAEVGRLNVRVGNLERSNNRYAQRVVYLMSGIDQLIRQIKRHNDAPVWTPNDWNPEEEKE